MGKWRIAFVLSMFLLIGTLSACMNTGTDISQTPTPFLPSMLSVKSNGESITPKEFWVWNQIWHGESWLNGDSFYTHVTSFDDDFCASLPSVILANDISISNNPDFTFTISKDIAHFEWGWEDGELFTYQRFSDLGPGTYYVKLNATYVGEYIPAGNEYTLSNSDFYFILTIL